MALVALVPSVLMGGCPPINEPVECPLCVVAPARMNHTAVALADGRVLIVGGYSGECELSRHAGCADPWAREALLFDPGTETFAPIPLDHARLAPTGHPLPSGDVVFAGGYGETGHTDLVERYEARPGGFIPLAPLLHPRSGHRAVLLPGDRLLLWGGQGFPTTWPPPEIYDVSTGEATAVEAVGYDVATCTGTLLPDGRVIFLGGGAPTQGGDHPPYAELDPSDSAPAITHGGGATPWFLRMHSTTLLPDGRLLIAGGEHTDTADGTLETAAHGWLLDLTTWEVERTAPMRCPRVGHEALLLSDGRVALVGGDLSYWGGACGEAGAQTIEVYDPARDTWTVVYEELLVREGSPSYSLLADGRILIVGGSGLVIHDGYGGIDGAFPFAELAVVPSAAQP